MVYSPVYFITILMTSMGGSFLLYSFGVINPAQEVVCDWLNEISVERYHKPLGETVLNVVWSFIVASNCLGAIFGALLTKCFAECFGRRNGLIINGVVAVAGSVLSLFCSPFRSPEMLIAGRILLGFAMGLASGLAPMYMMEVTPCRHRGVAGTVHQIAVAFSDWFSLFMGLPEIFGGTDCWPFALAFPGILSGIMVMVLPFMPESPKYILMQKGHDENAMKATKRLVGEVEAVEFFKKLKQEAQAAANMEQHKGSYKQLFTRPELRRPLIVTVLGVLAQQATGCGAVFAFSTHMFMKVSIEGRLARFATVVIGIVYFVFAGMSSFLIERVGRRRLLLTQLFVCGSSLAAMSAFTMVQQHHRQHWFPSYGSIGALLIYMAAYGLGSPVPWMIPNELFTTKFRSSAVTVSVVIVWTIMFIVSMTFMPLQQKIGIAYSYLPFVVGTFACAIALYYMLPETKHKEEVVVDDDDIEETIKYIESLEGSEQDFDTISSPDTAETSHSTPEPTEPQAQPV